MIKKAQPKKVKRLSLKKVTVKDLDIAPGKGGAVRGGGTSTHPNNSS